MKYAIIAFVAVFGAGSAMASDRVTDVDFLKANRCKGLATTLPGVVDAQALDSFIKAERGARPPYIMERASAEFDRARREAKGAERRDRLTSELNGICQAYVAPASNVTKQ